MANGKSKYENLCIAARPYAGQAQGIVFSGHAAFCDLENIPYFGGGTNLEAALQKARSIEPRHLLVICDGYPGNPEGCLAQARSIDCIIDTLYVGPPDDTTGIEFMQQLAAAGRGRAHVFDPTTTDPTLQIGTEVSGLLAIAPPTKIEL